MIYNYIFIYFECMLSYNKYITLKEIHKMNKTCCIFGHRKINLTTDQIKILKSLLENLIIKESVDTFIFGSKSQFDDLCLNLISELKEKYSYVKRIYIRAEYPFITKQYENYLLQHYESTYFPKSILKAGRAKYVERNYEMIEKSDICLIYYDKNYSNAKSGTYIAYQYAQRKNRKIINVLCLL